MKKVKSLKKLSLKKLTISKLTNSNEVRGGLGEELPISNPPHLCPNRTCGKSGCPSCTKPNLSNGIC